MADHNIRALERAFAETGERALGVKLRRAKIRSGEAVPSFVSLLVEHERYPFGRMTRRLTFGDSGVTLSIQAGPGHYCSKRDRVHPYEVYTEWEIGFERRLLGSAEAGIQYGAESLRDYWESPEADWTVAGYVPTGLVQALVEHLVVQYGEARSVEPEPAD